MHDTFDWIVIGSGPAGQRAAVQAAKVKKKVLIVEKESWGGACVHTGTIPSKTLREAALQNDGRLENPWQHIQEKKDRVLRLEAEIISHQLDRNHVKRIQGTAVFKNATSIEVGGQVYSGKKFLIGTGTRPSQAQSMPWDSKYLFDSDTLMGMKTLPQSLLVIGAGVIGCEYASIFARLGVKVTLIDRRNELLRNVDSEIVQRLRDHFLQAGIELLLGAEYKDSHCTDGFCMALNGEQVKYSASLACLGRQGNVEGLNLEGIGVQIAERGMIPVNKFYQTNLEHIYAAGDVIGPPALAASSAEQGRLAACHAFGVESAPFSKLFPYGIYTIPEISSVGAQESELQEKNIPFVVGRAKYSELARGQILGDDHGLLKLLVSKGDRKILGVHILGTGATELVHIGQTAMHFEGTVDFFVSNIFNYPTLAEAYKVAALNAKNQL